MSNGTKRVLLYGFFSQGNYGDDALLDAIIVNMREMCPWALEFCAAVRHPSHALSRQFGIEFVQNLEYCERTASVGRWIQGYNTDDGAKYWEFVRRIAHADLVIIGPGQYLIETPSDGLWKGMLAQLDAVCDMAKLTGTPVYGIGLTCEVLRSPYAALRVRSILNKLSALSFREVMSPKYLTSLGVGLPEFTTGSDLALSTSPSSPEALNVILESEPDLRNSEPYLAVAAHDVYWDHELRGQIEGLLTKVIEGWALRAASDVLLIPQAVNVDDGHADDRVYHQRLMAALSPKARRRVRTVKGAYRFDTIQALYGICSAALCTRMHGAIFALKQETPPLLLDFEAKRRACFDQIGLAGLLCRIDEPPAEIVSRLLSLSVSVEARNDIRERVHTAAGSARHLIGVAVELLRATPSSVQVWARAQCMTE